MELHEFDRRDFAILGVLLGFSDYQDCDTRDERIYDPIKFSTKKSNTQIL